MSTDSIIVRLKALDSGLLSDIMDEAGLPHQALATKLRPLIAGKTIAGPVVCARGEYRQNGAHATPSLPNAEIENSMHEDCILLINTNGLTDASPIGGIVSRSLKAQGCQAIVTDSPIRDGEEIRELDFQVFSNGYSPINATRRWHFVEINQPIAMPSVYGATLKVKNGDYLLGDHDGLVIIPQEHVVQIVEDAEQLKKIEAQITQAIDAGASRAEAFAQFPRFTHVRAVLAN